MSNREKLLEAIRSVATIAGHSPYKNESLSNSWNYTVYCRSCKETLLRYYHQEFDLYSALKLPCGSDVDSQEAYRNGRWSEEELALLGYCESSKVFNIQSVEEIKEWKLL